MHTLNEEIKIKKTNLEKVKSQNIEMRIEKTIDEKMEKILSQLDQKLNQMMNLIQPRTNTTITPIVQNRLKNPNPNLIPIVPRSHKDQNTSKNAFSTSWAQVVSRNITKSAKMHEKKDFAKSAKSDA